MPTKPPKKEKKGRPLRSLDHKTHSPIEVNRLIEEWKKEREEKGLPLTITSLAYKLHFTRESLLKIDRRKLGSSIVHILDRAKMLCHVSAEDLVLTAKNANGPMFVLANNWNWKSKTDLDKKDDKPPVAPVINVVIKRD